MLELREKILKEGKAIGSQIVKVDGFVNHQIDVEFMREMGKSFSQRFQGQSVDKILTVEASGIAIACLSSPFFGYPRVIFAKKAKPNTLDDDFFESEAKSFTKGTVSNIKVSKKFINKGDRVLILDDFLAHGQAALALCQIVEQAQGKVVGVGAVIEKKFQNGAKRLREKGYIVESLAVIEKIDDGVITFE